MEDEEGDVSIGQIAKKLGRPSSHIFYHIKKMSERGVVTREEIEGKVFYSPQPIFSEDVESGASLWDLEGFSVSTTRSHSSSHSYKSRYSNEDASSMTTVYPIPVTEDMILSFWCWYEIEDNYDMGFVEISTDGRSYNLLDTFNGDSTGWVFKEYSLNDYVNESIFIRFRYTTDSNTLDEGFYVDDIYPVADFNTITTLSNSIYNNYYDQPVVG